MKLALGTNRTTMVGGKKNTVQLSDKNFPIVCACEESGKSLKTHRINQCNSCRFVKKAKKCDRCKRIAATINFDRSLSFHIHDKGNGLRECSYARKKPTIDLYQWWQVQ